MKTTPSWVLMSLVCAGLVGCGESGSDDFFLDPDNTAPVARLVVDARVELGRPLLMDGATSEDGDGFITDYLFDPGDGTALLQSTSPQLFHTFEAPGQYTIALTVIDDDGTKDTDRVEVLVTEP